MAEWFYGELRQNEKHRNPMQGEFFRNDDPGSEARMLVREGIQNSLDARSRSSSGPVRVRIRVSGTANAAAWSEIAWIFEGVWPHYEAPGNGLVDELRVDRQEREKCPFLVFEDFGTTGLTGDTEEIVAPEKGERNAFYYFLRAEGESDKTGSDRGRWGLGKFVFPKASLVRSFLAVTRRDGEDESLLVGQYVLKCHKIDGVQYSPDGWFGSKNENGLWIPSRDQEAVERISMAFDIARKAEPGLSLVIPWCQKEIDSRSILAAVIRDFYIPLLTGDLVVDVVDASGTRTVDKHSFEELFSEVRSDIRNDAGSILLAMSSVEKLGSTQFRMERPVDTNPRIKNYTLSEEDLEAMRDRDEKGEIISVRVPVKVEPKSAGHNTKTSFFDVWIKRDPENLAKKPTYIREGLIIPDVSPSSRLRTHDALVLVGEGALAQMLGDAENPAHTNWSFRSENFVGRYKYGQEIISVVKNAATEIVDRIRGDEDQQDVTSLADLFRIPSHDRPGSGPGSGGGDGRPRPPTPPDERSAHSWRFHQVQGGLVISGNPEAEHAPRTLNVRLAYDRQKGSPATHWKPADFELGQNPIAVDADGEDLIQSKIRAGNQLEVRVGGPDYRIEIRGFDPNRDLWFDVIEERT